MEFAGPWLTVRDEYEKAPAKLMPLFDLLGKEKADELGTRIRLFFRAIERVDRCHDNLQTAEEREALRREITAFFQGEAAKIPEQLQKPLQELYILVDTLGRTQEFITCAESIFLNGELLRVQTDVRKGVTLALEEGALTAELMMISLDTRNPKFENFMREIGALGKLCDDIIDLHEDIEKGERSYENPYLFYPVALLKALSNAVSVLWNYPQYAKPSFFLQFIPSIFRIIKRKLFRQEESGTQS